MPEQPFENDSANENSPVDDDEVDEKRGGGEEEEVGCIEIDHSFFRFSFGFRRMKMKRRRILPMMIMDQI